MSLFDHLRDTPERQFGSKKRQVDQLESTLNLVDASVVDASATSSNEDPVSYPAQMQLLKQYKNELLALGNINFESKLAFLSEYHALLEAYQKFQNAGLENTNNQHLDQFHSALLNMANANREFYENNVKEFTDGIVTPPIEIYNKINISVGTMLVIGFCMMVGGWFSLCLPVMLAGLAIMIGTLLFGYGVNLACIQLPRLDKFYGQTCTDFNNIQKPESVNTTSPNAKNNARNNLGNFKHYVNQLFRKTGNQHTRDIQYQRKNPLFNR